MRAKQSLLFLTAFLLLLFLAACAGNGAEAPAGESAPAGSAAADTTAANDATPNDAAAPIEEAAGPDNEAYPAPQETAGENQEQAASKAYPAPGGNAEGLQDQPSSPSPPQAYPAAEAGYPPPSDLDQEAADTAAYPAPEEGAQATGQEPNTLLGPPGGEDGSLTSQVWRFRQFASSSGETFLPSPDVEELNSVEFFEDGRVAISAGCNTAHGTYSAVEGTINIQAVNATQAVCDEPSRGRQFLQWLNEAAAYDIEGGTLNLILPGDSGTMQLFGSDVLTYADRIAKVLVLTGGLGLPQAQPGTLDELMDESLEELVYREGITPEVALDKAPGAVVLIDSPAGSLIKAAGFANVEEQRPISTYDRLEIGSNTMMFTGVLLAQLQEEGLLSLDDSLGKWLPDLAATIPNGEQITLRQLATHTSGIPDYGEAVISAGAGDSEALRSGYTPEELVRLATENLPVDFMPGEPGQWHYSNTGYILLGMVLEAASGQSYAELLQNRIFSPLGMTNTELLEGTPRTGSIVDGYLTFPYENITTEWNGSQGWAAGGIISSAADMARFARALMSGAVFNDAATLAVMTDFIEPPENAAVGSSGGAGYGIGLIEFAPGLWGHRGQTIGFSSIVAMDPAREFLLIVLTNSAEGAMGREQQSMGNFLHLQD
jgi:D-alanyl-D-alanine carboxypeptidase